MAIVDPVIHYEISTTGVVTDESGELPWPLPTVVTDVDEPPWDAAQLGMDDGEDEAEFGTAKWTISNMHPGKWNIMVWWKTGSNNNSPQNNMTVYWAEDAGGDSNTIRQTAVTPGNEVDVSRVFIITDESDEIILYFSAEDLSDNPIGPNCYVDRIEIRAPANSLRKEVDNPANLLKYPTIEEDDSSGHLIKLCGECVPTCTECDDENRSLLTGKCTPEYMIVTIADFDSGLDGRYVLPYSYLADSISECAWELEFTAELDGHTSVVPPTPFWCISEVDYSAGTYTVRIVVGRGVPYVAIYFTKGAVVNWLAFGATLPIGDCAVAWGPLLQQDAGGFPISGSCLLARNVSGFGI